MGLSAALSVNATSAVGTCSDASGFSALGTLPYGRHVRCERFSNKLLQIDDESMHESKRQSSLRIRSVIVSCARNVEKELGRSLAFVTALGKHTSAFSVVIYEDSSTDATRRKLRQWVASGQTAHTKTVFFADTVMHATRTQRLALCRNTLMHTALQISRVAQKRHSKLPTIMVAVDLDCPHVLDRVLPGFRNALRAMHPKESSRFDVLTANSYPSYYDLWTIRSSKLLIDYDCWVGDACSRIATLPADRCTPSFGRECTCATGNEQVQRRGNCHAYQIFISPNAPMFAVDGGYSGLALYNADTLQRASCMFDGDARCEIVPFQACLRAARFRIGLVPNLLQGCGVEHSLRANTTMRGKRRKNVYVSSRGDITYATLVQK